MAAAADAPFVQRMITATWMTVLDPLAKGLLI